jgi:hypothetical protein
VFVNTFNHSHEFSQFRLALNPATFTNITYIEVKFWPNEGLSVWDYVDNHPLIKAKTFFPTAEIFDLCTPFSLSKSLRRSKL